MNPTKSIPTKGSVTNQTKQIVREQLIKKLNIDPHSKTDAMMIEHLVSLITKDVTFQLN